MGLVVLSNDNLKPWVNWSTLGPPLLEPLSSYPDARLLKPSFLSDLVKGRGARELLDAAWTADTVFWMQGSSRPETPLTVASVLAGRARRAAFVVDPWKSILGKLAWAARLQRLDPLFVPFREACLDLRRAYPRGRFEWLPFGVDTNRFRPRSGEKDIFIFWMGRRYEPLHQAILAFCRDRGLNYVYRQKGVSEILTPDDLGAIASRSHYFVATPPDLDDPARTGGYSPLVMRYMEGLAAGARILGVLPRSGEYETLLPRDAILTVAADGSDLAERLDADRADEGRWTAVKRAAEMVRAQHSWRKRAEQIHDRIFAEQSAFPI